MVAADAIATSATSTTRFGSTITRDPYFRITRDTARHEMHEARFSSRRTKEDRDFLSNFI